jgi:hypothetical protein
MSQRRRKQRNQEAPSSIAFGNQTISQADGMGIGEIHGFASPPLDRFAFIVCNRLFKELLLTEEQCEFIST